LAAKARLLGLRVLANDPPLQEQGCNDLVSLKTLLNEADIVSLHVPLEYLGHHPTYHLAGLAFFAQLKQGSVFINTSRGAVTDSAALKQALVAKPTLTHAILDVWEEEPEVDVNLLQQVTLLTPHIAGYSYEGRLRGSLQIYHQLASFCRSSLPFPSLSTEIGSLESIDLQVKPDSNLWGLLWQAVKEVYNIEQDCQNLKEQDFHQLRKNYPKRYEFSHYRLCLSQPHKEFERIARGLGFEVG
jgi:erythronate-4-phosphate dehydrogenase